MSRTPVLEKASKSVWELILDNNGLGKEINETVERVFCRLSGREAPLFPISNDENQRDKETHNEKGKENENKNKENSNSASKKRSFNAMNLGEGADEVGNFSGDPSALSEDSRRSR